MRCSLEKSFIRLAYTSYYIHILIRMPDYNFRSYFERLVKEKYRGDIKNTEVALKEVISLIIISFYYIINIWI